MGVELRPLAVPFGVEVVGLDVRDASNADRACVIDAFFERHLVLVRDQQQVSIDQQLAFASWFGTIRTPSREIHPHLRETDLRYTYLSNTREDGTGGGNAELTPHQDYSFAADPVGAICLYAIEVSTTGGETGFIDAAAAYSRLPAALRERIGTATAVHVERFPRGPTPNRVQHPVVLHHPVTGIPILFVNPLFTESIPDAGDESLLVELQASFAAPAIQYWHRWRPGDLLIWDNLALQHARNEFPAADHRTIRRCQVDFGAAGSLRSARGGT